MPVAESSDVPDDRSRRHAPRVVEAHVEPERGELVLLEEKVAHERGDVLEELGERDVLLRISILGLVVLLDLPQGVAGGLDAKGRRVPGGTEKSQSRSDERGALTH